MFFKQITLTVFFAAVLSLLIITVTAVPTDPPPPERKWGNHHSPTAEQKKEAEDAKKAVEHQTNEKDPLYFGSSHTTRPHSDKEDGKDDHTRHRYVSSNPTIGDRQN